MVTYQDILDSMGSANIYYSLTSEPLKNWNTSDTYQIGDRVKVRNANYSGSETIITSYRALTVNNNSNPSENPADWEEYSKIVETCINESYIIIESEITKYKGTFDDTDKFIKLMIVKYACALLIEKNNQMTNADSDDSANKDEKNLVMRLIEDKFNLITEDSPQVAPFAYISNSNAKVRTLAETDPNSYYNKDYGYRDLGK